MNGAVVSTLPEGSETIVAETLKKLASDVYNLALTCVSDPVSAADLSYEALDIATKELCEEARYCTADELSLLLNNVASSIVRRYHNLLKNNLFVQFDNVSKTFSSGEIEVQALSGVTFGIQRGEICLILGESGAGKTTLMNILGGIEEPTSGIISVNGRFLAGLSRRELSDYRRDDIGFVFQSYNLIPSLTTRENILLATQIAKKKVDPEDLLREVGLEDKIRSFPSQLSGGQQQRVAIARALAKDPQIILCDEPTAALDYQTSIEVLDLLQKTSSARGKTLVMISHNRALAGMANRIVEMKDGKVRAISFKRDARPARELTW